MLLHTQSMGSVVQQEWIYGVRANTFFLHCFPLNRVKLTAHLFPRTEIDLHCWRSSIVNAIQILAGTTGHLVLHYPEGLQLANNLCFLSERAARAAKEHFFCIISSVLTASSGSNYGEE